MLGLPWWAWLLLGVVAFLWVAFVAARSWRRTIRLEFVEFLRREAPEVEILTELDHELAVKVRGGGEGTLRLDRLYREGSQLKLEDTVARKDLFKRLLAVLRESPDIGRLESEEDRRRILPRLVTDSFLRQIRTEMSGEVLPALPLGVPGLSVVLVLDGETAVAYLPLLSHPRPGTAIGRVCGNWQKQRRASLFGPNHSWSLRKECRPSVRESGHAARLQVHRDRHGSAAARLLRVTTDGLSPRNDGWGRPDGRPTLTHVARMCYIEPARPRRPHVDHHHPPSR